MKHYCVDCMHFLRCTVYRNRIPPHLDKPKIRKRVERNGRAVVFWCRKTGAYYLNTHRIYELEVKDCEYFDDARI